MHARSRELHSAWARSAFFRVMNRTLPDGSRLASSHGLLLLNTTLVRVHIQEPFRDSQMNELLYVIVVIVFYATALMTLIVTQIKRQRREGTEVDYYDEYLQRNSEVKQTCQIASSIVARQTTKHPPPAVASAAYAAAATGTMLSRVPLRPDTSGEHNQIHETEGALGNSSLDMVTAEANGSNVPGLGPRVHYHRDKSPVLLESIPDLEA